MLGLADSSGASGRVRSEAAAAQVFDQQRIGELCSDITYELCETAQGAKHVIFDVERRDMEWLGSLATASTCALVLQALFLGRGGRGKQGHVFEGCSCG